jgi:hypothetical protein
MDNAPDYGSGDSRFDSWRIRLSLAINNLRILLRVLYHTFRGCSSNGRALKKHRDRRPATPTTSSFSSEKCSWLPLRIVDRCAFLSYPSYSLLFGLSNRYANYSDLTVFFFLSKGRTTTQQSYQKWDLNPRLRSETRIPTSPIRDNIS